MAYSQCESPCGAHCAKLHAVSFPRVIYIYVLNGARFRGAANRSIPDHSQMVAPSKCVGKALALSYRVAAELAKLTMRGAISLRNLEPLNTP